MRDRIIQLIIADRTRVLTLLVSLCLALAGGIATRLLGFELTTEHNAMITTIVTLVFGWTIEAWASEQNAKGAAKVQEALKEIAPDLEVDRHLGDKTVAAVEDAVIAAKAPTEAPTTKQQP